MTPDDAERVLALIEELDSATDLAVDEREFLADWRLRLAGERVVERIFQAATALAPGSAEEYFGAEGLRRLRGMRNRLAHNYLAVDPTVLWSALVVEVPAVRARLESDAVRARRVLGPGAAAANDPDEWRAAHMRRIPGD